MSESVLSRAHVTFDGGKTWSEYPIFSNRAYQGTGSSFLAEHLRPGRRLSVYVQRAYLQTFGRATAKSRKYLVLTTNSQDVIVFDLQDSIARSVLHLTVEKRELAPAGFRERVHRLSTSRRRDPFCSQPRELAQPAVLHER